jgi:hypothetical protein
MSEKDDLKVEKDSFGNEVFYDKDGNRVGSTANKRSDGSRDIFNKRGERTGEIRKNVASGEDEIWNASGGRVEKKDGKRQIPLGRKFPEKGNGCMGCIVWIFAIVFWVFMINWGSKIGVAIAIIMTIVEFNQNPNHPEPGNIIIGGIAMMVIFGLIGAGIWALIDSARKKNK